MTVRNTVLILPSKEILTSSTKSVPDGDVDHIFEARFTVEIYESLLA